jgi:hypothetical protein
MLQSRCNFVSSEKFNRGPSLTASLLTLLALLMAVTLAVFKPRGMTPYGYRKLLQSRRDNAHLAHGIINN